MEQKSILTPFQKKIFSVIIKDDFFREKFYFSGGTALAEFYLKHRYSEDLDFFTPEQVSYAQVKKRLSLGLKEMGVGSFETRATGGTKLFFLKKGGQEVVKVEFNYFPFKRLETSKEFKKMAIDSLFDLAVNKLDMILTRYCARDYIDLYFIFQQKGYSWQELLTGVKKKFFWRIDPLNLAARLKKIEELYDYPKMVKKFSRSKMINFYREQSNRLGQEIFEN